MARGGLIERVFAGAQRAALLVWVLARVGLFVTAGLSLFLVAFLGYFTLPFLFLGAALLVVAAGRAIHVVRRLRARGSR